jgi:hypothetical protein
MNNDSLEDQFDQSRAREALTEAIRQRVCEAARLGVQDRFAARYAGVPPRWLRRWMKTGKQAREPYEDNYQRQCALLYAGIEKARGDYVVNTLCKIEKAGGHHWQALAWKLRQFLTGYHFFEAQKKHRKKDQKSSKDQKSKQQEKWHDERPA